MSSSKKSSFSRKPVRRIIKGDPKQQITEIVSGEYIRPTQYEIPAIPAIITLEELKMEIAQLKTESSILKESTKQKIDLVIGIVSGIALATFLALVGIGLDYFKNNQERYEKFLDATNKFYTKDELGGLIQEHGQNKAILECLKFRGYFSKDCFKLQ